MPPISEFQNKGIAPHPPLKAYYATDKERQDFLNHLFNRLASDYDWIHRVASFGTSMWHRRRALRLAGLREGMSLLDVACGTGPVIECARRIVGPSGNLTGLDPSHGMMREILRKGLPSHLTQGIAEHLPFRDNSFDFVTMGYALRHVSELQHTFSEFLRVLKPGGIVLILELSRPHPGVIFHFSKFLLKTVVPRLAHIKTRNHQAHTLMRYYWDTIENCVSPTSIIKAMETAGFADSRVSEMVGGLIRDYIAFKSYPH